MGIRSPEMVEVMDGVQEGDIVAYAPRARKAKLTEGRGSPRHEPCDPRYPAQPGTVALTTVGIGMLLMIVMGMGGIYRGIIQDATLLVDRIGADLWIVQRDTKGPFAEISRVPAKLVHRAAAFPA